MKEGRDFWYQDLMRDASCECEPEWMDAEDPLFMLYTRYIFHTIQNVINSVTVSHRVQLRWGPYNGGNLPKV